VQLSVQVDDALENGVYVLVDPERKSSELTYSNNLASMTVSDGCSAAFTYAPAAGNSPLAVVFTDASTGSITDRLWDFGDGTTSTLQSPTHIYSAPGVYSVTLTVGGPHGSDDFTQVDAVTVYEPTPTPPLMPTPIPTPTCPPVPTPTPIASHTPKPTGTPTPIIPTEAPTPTAEALTLFEAENATLAGAIVSNLHPGYTGTGYADYQNPTGDYVQWTVNVEKAGAYTLSFRYANGDKAARPLDLRINGKKARRLSFNRTGSWDRWIVVKSAQLLSAGKNTIRLSAVGKSGGNIDSLRIKPLRLVHTKL
jgi:PKD repeat protein